LGRLLPSPTGGPAEKKKKLRCAHGGWRREEKEIRAYAAKKRKIHLSFDLKKGETK